LIQFWEDHGIGDFRQLRLLICDGVTLLRYVSIVQPRPFTRRQRAAFQRVGELVRSYETLRRRMRVADNMHAALATAMQALGRAAYIVDERGSIEHANTLGVAALDQNPDVAARIVGPPSRESYDVHRIDDARFLVVARTLEIAHAAKVIGEEARFGARTTAVLVCAARGASTKEIAARLDLATNTVEYHLTRIYRQLGVTSRTELHAALLERLTRHG
jgi:DNA-binding NarL/FixJ family response regulator